MEEKKNDKNKKYGTWISVGFVLLLIVLQSVSYFKNIPKFSEGNVKITVAEVYSVWKKSNKIGIRSTNASYVYKVGTELYESGTGGGSDELNDWNSPEIRKYPVAYNIENSRINFLILGYQLPDSLEIGIEIENVYFDNKSVKKIMLTQTVQEAYLDQEYFKKYLEIKKKIKE